MEKSTLDVTIFPMDIVQDDVDQNLKTVDDFFKNSFDGSDVVLIPELFSTGFITKKELATELAEPIDGKTLTQLRTLAGAYDTAIAGSFLCIDDNRLYNRAFFIYPGGETVYYDKRHLFCLSLESTLVNSGEELSPRFEYKGWKITLAVCYDLRFPAWLRNRGNEYDVMLIPANWPDTRENAWRTLLVARALENQIFVVGCNRSGSDKFGVYDNMSMAVDPKGNVITAPADGTNPLKAALTKDQLENIRLRFPVWRDADRFFISEE